jgi:nucleoside-diphosphate-sugar epimerase
VRNKVVLIPGGAGFVGSAVVRELLDKEATVISYDNYLHGTSKNFEGLDEFIQTGQFIVVEGDVFSQFLLRKQISDHHVNYIINCIGDPFIPATDLYPGRCNRINAEGTRSVLEVAGEYNIERIVHVSSCEVHGINNAPALTENEGTNPSSRYAKSKYRAEGYCSEFFARVQRGEQRTSLVVARLFNCYGPRATHPYIIPEIIKQLDSGNTLHLGNLTERDFTYVDDTAKALIALLTADFQFSVQEDPTCPEVINVGSGIPYSIAQLVRDLADIMEVSNHKIIMDYNHRRLEDIPRFVCNNAKLRKYTNWTPEVKIKEGLRKTVDWFNVHGCSWNLSQND